MELRHRRETGQRRAQISGEWQARAYTQTVLEAAGSPERAHRYLRTLICVN